MIIASVIAFIFVFLLTLGFVFLFSLVLSYLLNQRLGTIFIQLSFMLFIGLFFSYLLEFGFGECAFSTWMPIVIMAIVAFVCEFNLDYKK